MMGRLKHDPEKFFYSFRLDGAVPQDRPVRRIAAMLDLELGLFRTGALLSQNRPSFR